MLSLASQPNVMTRTPRSIRPQSLLRRTRLCSNNRPTKCAGKSTGARHVVLLFVAIGWLDRETSTGTQIIFGHFMD
jgi:hypothetical protein